MLVINKNIFFFFSELFFGGSSKAMWVAIDCRSENSVAVLKSFGITVLGSTNRDIEYNSDEEVHFGKGCEDLSGVEEML
jgi:hypothetical protein